MSVTIGGHDSFNPLVTIEVNNSFAKVGTLMRDDSFPKRVTIGMLDSLFVIATILVLVNSGSMLLSWAMIHLIHS